MAVAAAASLRIRPAGKYMVKQISQARTATSITYLRTHTPTHRATTLAPTHTRTHLHTLLLLLGVFVIHKFFSIRNFMHKSISLLCGRLLCTKVSRFAGSNRAGRGGELYKFTAAAARVAIASGGVRGV